MAGFLPLAVVTKGPPAASVPNCGECGLLKKCSTPKFPVSGRGRRGLLIVAERPSESADKRKRWLSGDGHTRLGETLAALGIDLERDCWLTYAQACRGTSKDAVRHCRPLLVTRIAELKPQAVLLLGQGPIQSVIGHLWRNNIGKDITDRWAGWQIPARPWNCWVCPTFDPAEVEEKSQYNGAASVWFKRHLEGAVGLLKERPWGKEVPDLRKDCRIIMDDKKAVKEIKYMWQSALKSNDPVAWDLETNCLKPDNATAAIACCSMASRWNTDRQNSGYAIAYPWTQATADATKEFLKSPVRKIASNMKFEDRWARKVIGCRVKNWWHDTMLAAHLLDNRKAVTSIKFQAFVRLGIEDYDSVVSPFLKATDAGGYAINRVFRCDWPTLLEYNALDSLLEYEVALIQRRLMFPQGE